MDVVDSGETKFLQIVSCHFHIYSHADCTINRFGNRIGIVANSLSQSDWTKSNPEFASISCAFRIRFKFESHLLFCLVWFFVSATESNLGRFERCRLKMWLWIRWLCIRWCCSALLITSIGWAKLAIRSVLLAFCSDAGDRKAFSMCPIVLQVCNDDGGRWQYKCVCPSVRLCILCSLINSFPFLRPIQFVCVQCRSMKTTRTSRCGSSITIIWTACTVCSRRWMHVNVWSAGITPDPNCIRTISLSTNWFDDTVQIRCWSSSMPNQKISDCPRKRILPSKRCTKMVRQHRKHLNMCPVKLVLRRPKKLVLSICYVTSRTRPSVVYHKRLQINCSDWRGSTLNCVTSKTIWSRWVGWWWAPWPVDVLIDSIWHFFFFHSAGGQRWTAIESSNCLSIARYTESVAGHNHR